MFDPISAISTTLGFHRIVTVFHYFGSSLVLFVPKLRERNKILAEKNITAARIAQFNSEPSSSGLSSGTSSEGSSSGESYDDVSSDEESSDGESSDDESSNGENSDGETSDVENSNEGSPKENRDINDDTEITDIEELHTLALREQSRTYIDPATGFTVFTEYSHLKRGKCCGSMCRHCPYGWENVKYQDENGKMVRKEPKVESGDKENVKRLLDKIESSDACIESMPEVIVACANKSCTLKGPEQKLEQKKHGKGGRSGGALTTKNVPYTRSGDAGTSVLITGERRSKDDLSFEAMGTVDELCSIVGTVHAELTIDEQEEKYGNLSEWMLDIMSRLFDIGSHIANPLKVVDGEDVDEHNTENRFSPDGIGGGFDSEHIDNLEECVDVMTDALPELGSFILPTGGRATTQLHVARCVCRRAERRILPLVKIRVSDPNAMRYLNRLSDFFFTAARYVNYCEGRDELMYKRHFRGSKQRDRVVVKLREEK